jgi:methyl-accepting chemotaxis protein
MANDKNRPSFFAKLRRTARTAQKTVATKTALDHNAVWQAHEKVSGRAKESAEMAQRLVSAAARERGAVEAVAERARSIALRAKDAAETFGRVVEPFERLEVVALNAGLEGARLGEAAGKALVMVSDAIRGQAQRGSESAREVKQFLDDLVVHVMELNTQLEFARDAAVEVTQEVARIGGTNVELDHAVVELTLRLRRATGSDPETVRAIGEATEHARALVTALGTLSGTVPRGLLLAAIKPALEPLVRLLSEDEGDTAEDEDDE